MPSLEAGVFTHRKLKLPCALLGDLKCSDKRCVQVHKNGNVWTPEVYKTAGSVQRCTSLSWKLFAACSRNLATQCTQEVLETLGNELFCCCTWRYTGQVNFFVDFCIQLHYKIPFEVNYNRHIDIPWTRWEPWGTYYHPNTPHLPH